MDVYGELIFNQNQHNELERLNHITTAFDSITKEHITQLNLPSNSRCLDIGSGTGSIASWLSVHSQQRNFEVMALDRDGQFLPNQASAHNNFTVLKSDISKAHSLGEFDLIHARLVLIHLRDRSEVLEKLVSWLKPGGWIILSEFIDTSTTKPRPSAYSKTMKTMWEVLYKTIGTDCNWGNSLPDNFNALGLKKLGNSLHYPPLSSGSPISAFWCLTWMQMKHHLLTTGGLHIDTYTQAIHNLNAGNVADLSPGLITCWGQR